MFYLRNNKNCCFSVKRGYIMDNFLAEQMNDDTMKITLSKKMYEKLAVLNASYANADKATIKIDSIDDDYVAVFVKFKNDVNDSEAQDFAAKFLSDVIDYQIRLDLDVRTDYIKKLIYEKAFSALKVTK